MAMRAAATFELNGTQFEIVLARSDEELDTLENELNAFEVQCQLVENRSWMEAHPHICMRTELRSFTARMRLFERRVLIVGLEVLAGGGKRVVYTNGVQFSHTHVPPGKEEREQSFGMLERVHVDKRRGGLSNAFFMESASLVTRPEPMWGYIERMNKASLGRATTSLEQQPDAPLLVYGGHTMMVRRGGGARGGGASSRLRKASPEFLPRYYGGSNFAPAKSIWEDWSKTGKLLGGFELSNGTHTACVVAFLCDWEDLKSNDGHVMASQLVILSNLAFFDAAAGQPCYDKLPVGLACDLIDEAQRACKMDYALVDVDEQSGGPIIVALLGTSEVVSMTREWYDIVAWNANLITPTWKARFLDPRHMSSLLFFTPKESLSKL